MLVSHDLRTIPDYAHERVAGGPAMPGVVVAAKVLPMSVVIGELALFADASEDCVDQIV